MIGLEYILQINNITLTDLSKELDITRANFYNWINGVRKIPEYYLNIFSDRFSQPKEYFNMKLDDGIKILILKNEIAKLEK